MRLIDADVLIEYIRSRKFSREASWDDFEDVVDDIPTACDVEAKVAELEEASYLDWGGNLVLLRDAISIVRGKE